VTIKNTIKSAESLDGLGMFRAVFDAMPSLIFIVDEDVRIQEYNAAAAEFLSDKRENILQRRGGTVLNCIHSTEVPQGCGKAAVCENCVVRNSVSQAFRGNRVVRRRTRIEAIKGRDKLEIYALITASPFQFDNRQLVLLVIEDISEIAELQRIIPICSYCRELRDEKETWSQLEAYFREHWDVNFSHSICPKCYEKEMKRFKKKFQPKL
jgi:PAS domain-containing protein